MVGVGLPVVSRRVAGLGAGLIGIAAVCPSGFARADAALPPPSPGGRAPAIEGSGTCPTPAEVARKLRPLLGDGTVGEGGDRVRIEPDEQALRVALVAADGRVRGVRHVDRRHDCDELAEAAAIIVASWQGQAPASDEPRRAAPAPGTVGRSPTAISGVAHSARAVGEPAPEPTGVRWFVGLGVVGNAVATGGGGSIAPALALEANAAPSVRGFGLHLRALAGARASEPLPNGEAQWRRSALALGPAWSWASDHVIVEADVSLAAALLRIGGTGYEGNESHAMLDVGALAGLRAHSRRGLAAFAGVGAGFWPRRTIAYQAPDLVGSALPRWQWLLEAGLGWDH
jgi:hypothetical protein